MKGFLISLKLALNLDAIDPIDLQSKYTQIDKSVRDPKKASLHESP